MKENHVHKQVFWNPTYNTLPYQLFPFRYRLIGPGILTFISIFLILINNISPGNISAALLKSK